MSEFAQCFLRGLRVFKTSSHKARRLASDATPVFEKCISIYSKITWFLCKYLCLAACYVTFQLYWAKLLFQAIKALLLI